VPTSTVSRIEAAESDPTVTMLERPLAAAGAQLVVDITASNHSSTLAALATAVVKPDDRVKIDMLRTRVPVTRMLPFRGRRAGSDAGRYQAPLSECMVQQVAVRSVPPRGLAAWRGCVRARSTVH
jgi:hypothetical protein